MRQLLIKLRIALSNGLYGVIPVDIHFQCKYFLGDFIEINKSDKKENIWELEHERILKRQTV